MPFLNIKTNKFYYEIHGEGEPLVLISGLKGDHANWLPVLDSLSKNYKVLIFDNRGIGKTTDQTEELTVEMMAQDVMHILEKLEIHQPHVIGHSLGGAIAQVIAYKYPDKIKSLTICNSFSKFNQKGRQVFADTLALHQQGKAPSAIMSQIIPYVFSEKFVTPQLIQLIEETADANLFPQSCQNYQRQYHALCAFDSTPWISDIKVPTMVISGKYDPIATEAESIEITNRISHAKHYSMNTGHASLVEEPRVFCNLIIEFIKILNTKLINVESNHKSFHKQK